MHVFISLLLLSVTGLLVLGLAGYSWRHRSVGAAPALAWLALSIAIWVLMYALELWSGTLQSKVISAKLQYIGIASTPLAWMIFARQYAGDHRRLPRRQLLALLIIPIVTIALVATNELHLLIWRTVSYTPGSRFPALKVDYGPWFWVHAAYCYILMALGSNYLIRLLFHSADMYRRQIGSVLLCSSAPWLGNALYIFRVDPLYPLDLTPFAFTFSAVALGWSLFRFELLNIMPVAHSTIFGGMRDAVIVLDVQNRLVDLNHAARRMTEQLARATLGEALDQILPGQPNLLERCEGAGEARVEITVEESGRRAYEAQVTPLFDQREQLSGRMIMLHDITESKHAEENERLLADASSLLASSLEPEARLITVARLTVPRLADWCIIHMVEDDGTMRRIALTCANPHNQALAEELHLKYPLDPNAPHSYPRVFRTGVSELIAEVTDKGLAAIARDQRHLEILRSLGIRSTISVPLIARGRTIGTIMLMVAESQRRYGEADLRLAEELAGRVALAVDNARLFANSRASEQRYRTLIAQAADSILLTTPAGAIIDANEQASALLGYSHAELLSMNLIELLGPPGNYDTAAMLAALRAAGQSLLMRRKDQTYCQIEVSVGTFTEPARDLFIMIIHDVSERLLVESRLRRQNEELIALHDTMHGLIDRLDLDGLLESLVARAGALLDTPHGYLYLLDPELDELVVRIATGLFGPYIGSRASRGQGMAGQAWESGLAQSTDNYSAWQQRRPELDALGLRALVSVPIRSGAQFVGVLGLAHQENGRVFDADEIALLQRFADMASLALENARLYSAAQQELGERRRTEQALLHTEAELRSSMDLVEAATRAKSTFLAHMSHEIRTPMTSVIGMAELLGMTKLDADQQELVDILHTSCQALRGVVNNILDFSKIESGHIDLDRAPFDLRECVENAISVIAGLAAKKQLEIGYAIDRHVPELIFGDMSRLRQILLNLLNNAIKFTSTGDVFVAVDAAVNDDESYQLHFVVHDTGIGIAPEQIDKVFSAFSQGDSTIPRLYGGTGLGLTISKSLSELMGGQMWAESSPGVGSSFHFTIRAPGDHVELSPQELRRLARLAGKRLLLVSQYARGRAAIEQQAQAWAMQVAASASASEALAWLRRGDQFDGAIVDLGSAKADGRELVEQLRRDRAPDALPLLLLIPLDLRDDEHPAVGEQVQGVLRKPLKMSQLEHELINLFNAGSDTQALPANSSTAAPSAVAEHALRILVVEDDATNRTLHQHFLEQLGQQSFAAEGGQQALEALERDCYDVVLLDMQLDDMDGAEVARLIRTRQYAQRPYLIAVTGDVLAGARDKYLQAGLDDYLSKPMALAQLENALQRFRASASTRPTAIEQAIGRRHIAEVKPAPEELTAQLDDNAPRQSYFRAGAEASSLSELLNGYLEDGAALIQTMRAASAQSDDRALQRAAHKLKSSSAMVAAGRMAELCDILESPSASTQSSWQAQLDALTSEFERVKQALQQNIVD